MSLSPRWDVATARTGRGWQGRALGMGRGVMGGVVADRSAKLEKSGRGPGLAYISVVRWREAAKATGLNRGRVHEVTRALIDGGAVVLDGDFVRPAGGAA